MAIKSGLIEKLKDPLHKNAIFLMMNSLGTSSLGFIFWILVAKLYSPDNIGLASAVISSMLLLAMLSNLGFGIGLIRFLPDANKKDANDIINSCFTMSGILSLVLVVIFLSGLGIWSPPLIFIRKNIFFIILFFLITLIAVLTSLLSTILVAKRAVNYIFIKDSVIFSSLKIVLPLFLVPLGAFGIFSSWGLAAFVAFILAIIFFLKKVQPGYKMKIIVKKDAISHMLHFSLGNHVGEIFRAMPALILPLMILNILSAPDAGYFYISWMMAGLLFMIPTAISTSLLAEGSIKERSLKENLKKALVFILILLLPALFVIYFLGNGLLLLIGKEYSEYATTLLQILALSSIPFAINIIYITIKRVEKKVKEIIGVYGIMAFGTLGLSYLSMEQIGLISVGIGWLISQIIITIIILLTIGKKVIEDRIFKKDGEN